MVQRILQPARRAPDTVPVIFETIPTYANLFGTIHRSYDTRGGWNSDFMDLRPGSVLRADGGFLVMYAYDALTESGGATVRIVFNHRNAARNRARIAVSRMGLGGVSTR